MLPTNRPAVLRQPLPPECRRRAECTTTPDPKFRAAFGPRGVMYRGRPTRTANRPAALGQDRRQKDRGHGTNDRSAWRPATTSSSKRRPTSSSDRRGQANRFVWLNTTTCTLHAHEEEEPRPSRPLAVALPRHDRPRQERQSDASAWTTSESPTTRSCSTRRTTARTGTAGRTARRRHFAAKRTRTGKAPSASDSRPLAGRIKAGSISSAIVRITTGCHIPCHGWGADIVKLKKGYRAIGRTYKNHIDGFNLLPPLTAQ